MYISKILKQCLTLENVLSPFSCTKFISYVLSASGIKDAAIYVLTVRFCALILEILRKIYVTEFFLSDIARMKMHRHLWLRKWLCLFLSHISHFISQTSGQILPWICRQGASLVLQVLYWEHMNYNWKNWKFDLAYTKSNSLSGIEFLFREILPRYHIWR